MEQDFGSKHERHIARAQHLAPAAAILPGSAVRVRKVRPDGSEKLAWDGVVLRADPSGVVVRAEFNLPQIELGCTTFRRGDVFVEFYVWGRHYTVAQVSAPGELSYVDLILDLWHDADDAIVLLDE